MRARGTLGGRKVALLSSLLVAFLAAQAAVTARPRQQQPAGAAAPTAQPPGEQSPTAAGASGTAPASTISQPPTAAPAANTTANTPTAPAGHDEQKPADGPIVKAAPVVQIDNDKPVIVHSDLITITVTVTDTYGRFVTGLGQKAFAIFDDKIEQQITHFSDEDAPVSLGVIFDVSGSMSGDKISKAREALQRFIETSHTRDEYFLIGFNHRAQLLMDRTRDSEALLKKLTFVQTKGQTALYDATYLGVERVTRGAHQKRAVLLISDGQDNSSRYTFNELRRLLKETDVIIYAVGIVSGADDSQLGYAGRSILEELAGVSGGKAFFPSTGAEMNDTFERIALELRTQYSIGYRPSNFANDGKWHKIKIKVQPPRGFPRLFVRGREGYYATAKPR
ncbi:MAG TPA: VWA domain-containing protein [Pyrinomonadaceae bacterium]|nr:VWA domain-containing protein [Pyrinomonadaceae bacterium]